MCKKPVDSADEAERCIHELRGLLICGNYAKLLLQDRGGPLSATQRQYLEVIHGNVLKIKEVVSRLDAVLGPGKNLHNRPCSDCTMQTGDP